MLDQIVNKENFEIKHFGPSASTIKHNICCFIYYNYSHFHSKCDIPLNKYRPKIISLYSDLYYSFLNLMSTPEKTKSTKTYHIWDNLLKNIIIFHYKVFGCVAISYVGQDAQNLNRKNNLNSTSYLDFTYYKLFS